MKILISFIISIILCAAYMLCIDLCNIYRPIAHMDISIGILLRLSSIVMFLTLLIGMLIIQFTKRKYLLAPPIIIPIGLWSCYISPFSYRSFAYMGISILIYVIYISILCHCTKKIENEYLLF